MRAKCIDSCPRLIFLILLLSYSLLYIKHGQPSIHFDGMRLKWCSGWRRRLAPSKPQLILFYCSECTFQWILLCICKWICRKFLSYLSHWVILRLLQNYQLTLSVHHFGIPYRQYLKCYLCLFVFYIKKHILRMTRINCMMNEKEM